MNLEVCRKCGSLYCTIKKRRYKKLIRFCCKNNDYYLFPLFIYYKKINLSFKKQIENFLIILLFRKNVSRIVPIMQNIN